VMHFDWFNIRSCILVINWGGEDDGHTWFQDTGFNTTDWDSSNTSNFVDILKG
jgi:hypothetical protein